MHVVELQPPGEMFHEQELELAIHTAADIPGDRIMRCAIRCGALCPAQSVHEGSPLSIIHRESGPQENVVLLDSKPVKAASIQYRPQVRVPGERKIFHRGIPSAEGIAVCRYNVDGIAVGSSDIHISTREQLRPRGGREQHQAQECQRHGCDFRHENNSSLAIYASSKFYLNA